MNKRGLLLLVGCFFISACEPEIKGGGTAGAGGAGGSANAGGAGGSSGGGDVQCTAQPVVFPSFDKSCVAASDCAVALHQINCCGTLTAIGINANEVEAFNAAESTCQMQYPGCGCAQFPTTTEDGKTSMDDTQIQVGCTNGQCSTFLP